jgi:hypothetical protein
MVTFESKFGAFRCWRGSGEVAKGAHILIILSAFIKIKYTNNYVILILASFQITDCHALNVLVLVQAVLASFSAQSTLPNPTKR